MISQSHVDESLLRMVAAERVHLLALQLVLNTLSVRCVPNEGKNRSYALDEESALRRLCVVQCRLHAIVAIRVAEKLFKSCTVEKLLDQHFACVVFSNANTLKNGSECIRAHASRTTRTFSMTLELNFWTDKAQTLPANWRMTASLNRLSFRSRMYCTT